jgi:PAS domain S-box-containing protein
VGSREDLHFARGVAAELIEPDEPFRLLVDAVEDYAIFMLSPDGRVASWNAGAGRLKGYDAEEILGRHFSVFYTPEDREAGTPQYLLDRAARDGHVSAEGWRVRSDGSRFWARVVITAMRDAHGDLVGFGKVTRDRTERKAHEEEIARSNEELEAFVGVVSHDLREPLQVIAAFAELLTRRLAASGDAESRTMAERIDRSATRMRQLVDGVRAYASVGGRELVMDTVDLGVMARDVLDGLSMRLDEAGVEVVVGPLPTLRGDATHLGQVLQNLVDNAAKFGATQVRISARRGPAEWVVEVADDGPGIPAREAGRVFEMFARLGEDAEASGSGIGLAICKKAVEAHGGRIWVRPNHGPPAGGSVFAFSLPAPAG